MEKDEFSKLLSILKKINEIVKNTYTKNETCIISTYDQKYVEIGLAIWIYFFRQTADISFDNVIKLLGYKIIGNIHDEIQAEVINEQTETFGRLAVSCIQAAGLEWKLNCPLDGEYKVGLTWAQTH